MAITLLAGAYADRYRCPSCNRFVNVMQTTFGRPCENCGNRGDSWKWELSRWRLVLGWPLIVWDMRDGQAKDSWDEW